MRVIIAIIAVSSFAMVAIQASSQTIGIYADLEGTSTNISLVPGVPEIIYVLATGDGQTEEGFSLVEFAIAGVPASWSIEAESNPEINVIIGNPLLPSGAALAFGECWGVTGYVHIYTLTVIATDDVPIATLSVVQPDYGDCPQMIICVGEDFETICATGGQATLELSATSDVCEGAVDIPWCSNFSTQGNTMPMMDDYSPAVVDGEGCTGRTAFGPDEVYGMELQPGFMVHATYTQQNNDGSFYVITDCSDPQGSCVVGADDFGWGETETIDWTVETGGTYYLICDTWELEPQGGPFTLDVTIDCSVEAERVNWGSLKNLYR